jgi:hypothetical protein
MLSQHICIVSWDLPIKPFKGAVNFCHFWPMMVGLDNKHDVSGYSEHHTWLSEEGDLI